MTGVPATYTLGTTTGQTLTVSNNLLIGDGVNPLTVTASSNNPIIDVNGNITISASSTFVAPTSSSFTIGGNWTNNGTFNNASGTVTFDTATTKTIDVQVAASADDGWVHSTGTTFNNTEDAATIGYADSGVYQSFYRFTGITIPQGSPITSCYLSLYGNYMSGSALTKFYFEKANNPSAVTSLADYNLRATTTVGVDWDGAKTVGAWNDSPSLVSVCQELINTYGLNNQAIQVLHKDDGSSAANNYQQFTSWDYTGNANGVKLHIEYTPTNKTISGNLNATSSFYKMVFNGTTSAWTITDPIRVMAPNATNTFVTQTRNRHFR